jgi:hypothetical protein
MGLSTRSCSSPTFPADVNDVLDDDLRRKYSYSPSSLEAMIALEMAATTLRVVPA